MSSSSRRCVRRFNRTGLIISPVKHGYCHLAVQTEREITTVVGLRIYQLNGKLKGTSYFSDFSPLSNHRKGVYYPEIAPSNFSPIIVVGTRVKRSSVNPVHTLFQFKVRTPGRSNRKLRFKVDIIGVHDPDECQVKILKKRIAVLENKLRVWKQKQRYDLNLSPKPLARSRTEIRYGLFPRIEVEKWNHTLTHYGSGRATDTFTEADEIANKVVDQDRLNVPDYERYQKYIDRGHSSYLQGYIDDHNRASVSGSDKVTTYQQLLASMKITDKQFHSRQIIEPDDGEGYLDE